MLGLGRPVVAGGRLRHGHVPIPVVLFDLWLRYVVLAKGNDRGCDGMVGRSCCMIGCDRYAASLHPFWFWLCHQSRSVQCWRPGRWWGRSVVMVWGWMCVCGVVVGLIDVTTTWVPWRVHPFYPFVLLWQFRLPSTASVCRYDPVVVSSRCIVDCKYVVLFWIVSLYICCLCGLSSWVLVAAVR